VDGAAHRVVKQAAQVQGFVHNALPTEGAITVQQHGCTLLALMVVAVKLLGACLAQDQGVDSLEQSCTQPQQY
jgi:hypothetical protein